MRTGRSAALAAAVAMALVFAGPGCGGDGAEGKPGHGVVLRVDAAARTVSIEHGDIPGMMRAMTMTFALAPEVSLEGISPGTEVDFHVMEEGGVYTVTRLQPAAP